MINLLKPDFALEFCFRSIEFQSKIRQTDLYHKKTTQKHVTKNRSGVHVIKRGNLTRAPKIPNPLLEPISAKQ